jgi:GTPase SAR1 family protein
MSLMDIIVLSLLTVRQTGIDFLKFGLIGQTGSGKTYTMVGILDDSEEEGLIPRISRDLILQSLSKKNTRDVVTNDLIVDIKLQVSFFEIYNERVYDLLSSSDNIAPCRVREHPETGAFIEGLTYRTVGSYEAVSLSLYEGFRRRITGETLMNANSSRSHAVFTIYMTQTRSSSSVSLPSQGATINSPRCKRSQSLSESTPSSPSSPASSSPASSPAPSPSSSSRRSLVDPSLNTFSRISKISLVDLAGSERLDATRSKGMRMKEGTMINLSLSTLGDVIKALSCAQKESATMISSLKHVPYRNSALTWVLKDCIGGNSRTTIMATISPHAPHYAESLNTIRFITKAKLIVNKVRVNEKRTDDTSGSLGASEEVVKEMGVKLQVFEKRISELEQIIRKHGLSSEMLESLFPDEERTEWSGEGDGEREGEGNENDLESPVGVGEGEGDGEEAMATDVERVNNSLSDDEEGLNQILPLDDLVVQVSDSLTTILTSPPLYLFHSTPPPSPCCGSN